MKIKFQNINDKVFSTTFLQNKNIVSIIRKSFDKKIDDLSEEWMIYSQPDLFKDIVKECYLIVEEKWKDYDYIVSLGNNAIPLAYSLGIGYNKKVIFVDDEWGITCFFQKMKPSNIDLNNCKLLLILPYFESGLKASRGIDVLNKMAKDIHVDVLTIVFFPEYIDEDIFQKNDYQNCFLYYLFHWDQKIKKQVL